MNIDSITLETVRNLIETRYDAVSHPGLKLKDQEKEKNLILRAILQVCEFCRLNPIDFMNTSFSEKENNEPHGMVFVFLVDYKFIRKNIVFKVLFNEALSKNGSYVSTLTRRHGRLMDDSKIDYRKTFDLLKASVL